MAGTIMVPIPAKYAAELERALRSLKSAIAVAETGPVNGKPYIEDVDETRIGTIWISIDEDPETKVLQRSRPEQQAKSA